MSFRITYRRLFTVNLFHGYYLDQEDSTGAFKVFDAFTEEEQKVILKKYDFREALRVRPTAPTQQLLADRGLVFREEASGIFVGIELNPNAFSEDPPRAIPNIPLDQPITMAFSVELVNPYFLNVTGLPLKENEYRPYYFSNRSENAYVLSKPIPAYNTERSYQAGDLHVDVEGSPTQLFEAIRNTGPGARLPADWEEISPIVPYSTYADRLPIYSSQFMIDLSGSRPASATLEIRDGGSEAIVLTTTLTGAPDLVQFPVDLRGLNAGKYDLTLKHGEIVLETPYSGPFYLDSDLYMRRVWGIIEIEHDPASTEEPLQLVNVADQTLKDPITPYTLHLKARRTFWRYIFQTAQSVTDSQLAASEFERDPLLTGGGAGVEQNRFKTKTLKPLARAVTKVPKFVTDEFLPNPAIGLIKPEADKQIYSEIFLP